MIPLGFSGGSQDRLMVLAVADIRWTVGTADGAGRSKGGKITFIYLYFHHCVFCVCMPFVCPQTVGFVRSFG